MWISSEGLMLVDTEMWERFSFTSSWRFTLYMKDGKDGLAGLPRKQRALCELLMFV